MNYLVKGLIARLKAVTTITAIVTNKRIFSDVPQGAIFPYLTIDVSGDNAHTKDKKSQTYQIIVSSWSRLKTREEASRLIELVKDALNRKESLITLDTGTLVRLDFITEDCYKDPDGVTWHGVVIFNAYIDLGG